MKFFFNAVLLSILFTTPRFEAYYTGSNFLLMLREHVENNSPFVDKTMFIRDFILSPLKYMIITRPHKWGKSLNMDMLHQFLAIEVDKEGNTIDDNLKTYKPIFNEGKLGQQNRSEDKYPRLKIADCPSVMEKNQGKWPVLRFDFSRIKFSPTESFTESTFVHKFSLLAKKVLPVRYPYLKLDCNKQKVGLSDTEQELFDDFYSGTGKYNNTIATCQKFIYIMITALYNYFDKLPIYVLIDNYDSIVNKVFFAEEPIFSHIMNNTLESFEAIFLTFQVMGLEHKVKKVLMTGILPYLQTRSYSKLNTYHLISVTDTIFSEYYGFTKTEVETLVNEAPGLENRKAVLTNIINWFDGYQMGNHEIFNPWSTLACLHKKGEIGNYWRCTESTEIYTQNFITDQILRHELVLMIFNDETISSPHFGESFSYLDLKFTKASILLTLLHKGLLTAKGISTDTGTVLRYNIPNRETRSIIYQEILRHEIKKLGAVYENLPLGSENPITYLAQGKIGLFREKTTNLLIYYCKASTTDEESFFWLMVALIFPALYEHYNVLSVRNFDSGGTFWRFIPLNRADCVHLPIVIFGYKYVHSTGELRSACKQVINQIIAKNYTDSAEVANRSIYYVGAAVSKWKYFMATYARPLQNGTLFTEDSANEENSE